ncbi:MAG: hypothetical protein F7B60_01460 [Desulfurococcales archaeon]|nr:hypothetical protein [Desulfurococcales archaeon]
MSGSSIYKSPAIAYIGYQTRYLCRRHFIKLVEYKMDKILRRHRMACKVLGNSDDIGSIDSAVLLAALSESPMYQV